MAVSLPPAGCWGVLPSCHVAVDNRLNAPHSSTEPREDVRFLPHGAAEWRTTSNRSATAHLFVGFLTGGARARPAIIKMLTDTILEEDFDKNGEAWYKSRDLEHGRSRSTVWSHPKPGFAAYRQQNNVTMSCFARRLCICLSVVVVFSKITQQTMNGFWWKFQDSSAMTQWTICGSRNI